MLIFFLPIMLFSNCQKFMIILKKCSYPNEPPILKFDPEIFIMCSQIRFNIGLKIVESLINWSQRLQFSEGTILLCP